MLQNPPLYEPLLGFYGEGDPGGEELGLGVVDGIPQLERGPGYRGHQPRNVLPPDTLSVL